MGEYVVEGEQKGIAAELEEQRSLSGMCGVGNCRELVSEG